MFQICSDTKKAHGMPPRMPWTAMSEKVPIKPKSPQGPSGREDFIVKHFVVLRQLCSFLLLFWSNKDFIKISPNADFARLLVC
jgi:hypothetical protein